MQPLKAFEDTVAAWPRISVYSRHVHDGGIVDIPFPRSIRDALLTEGLAEEHRWVPNSGWITFRVRNNTDLPHAVWLMRLSYFRYALKAAPDPRELFAEANQELQLTARFKALLEQFVPLTKWPDTKI